MAVVTVLNHLNARCGSRTLFQWNLDGVGDFRSEVHLCGVSGLQPSTQTPSTAEWTWWHEKHKDKVTAVPIPTYTDKRYAATQQWLLTGYQGFCQHQWLHPRSGSRGTWGPGPLAPKISSESCSFRAILRENAYIEQILGSGPPLGQKLRWAPLTKILDPRLHPPQQQIWCQCDTAFCVTKNWDQVKPLLQRAREAILFVKNRRGGYWVSMVLVFSRVVSLFDTPCHINIKAGAWLNSAESFVAPHVYVCVCWCVCVGVCVWLCVCLYVHGVWCVCTCECEHVCMHVCAPVYLSVCVCVYLCIWVCVCRHVSASQFGRGNDNSAHKTSHKSSQEVHPCWWTFMPKQSERNHSSLLCPRYHRKAKTHHCVLVGKLLAWTLQNHCGRDFTENSWKQTLLMQSREKSEWGTICSLVGECPRGLTEPFCRERGIHSDCWWWYNREL